MPKPIEHPEPHADWNTRGYWEGCGREEIVLQRCTACARIQHRPRGLCASCLSSDIEHFTASGRGTVYTFTVTHQNQAPGFREACPYVLAYVELDEGPRLLTNIVDCDPETVAIGMEVVADFAHQERQDGEAFAVPRFKPA